MSRAAVGGNRQFEVQCHQRPKGLIEHAQVVSESWGTRSALPFGAFGASFGRVTGVLSLLRHEQEPAKKLLKTSKNPSSEATW